MNKISESEVFRSLSSHSRAANGGAAGAALSAGYRGFGDDPLDGAGTAPAADAAAEAAVDLQCAQRLLSRCRHHDPYVVVSQDIA
jgi:hypothetical protein